MKKLIALLLAAVMVVSFAACSKGGEDSTTSPTESTGGNKIESDDPIYKQESYTVSAADAATKMDVAVATVGSKKLTNSLLQVYYWMNVYNFLNNNGAYLSYYGLDYTKPFDQQPCSGTAGTWEHYFLSGALGTWHSYQAMALMAEKENVPMNEDLKKELDGLKDDLEKSAEENKFESVDAMLQSDIAPGITYADYEAYLSVYYAGYSYYSAKYSAIEITNDMIEDYFTEHEAELEQSGITKDSGDVYAVRHILIKPEGGAKDEQGNMHYSDAEWEACQDKAQKLLDEWLAGDATEDSFAELAEEHSTDPGSNTNGGLYDGLNKNTNFVTEFKDWYLAEGRKAGDYGLVKTDYGYHIMYFSGTEAQWVYQCRNAAKETEGSKIIKNAMDSYPITTDYTLIVLAEKDLTSKK